nr:immunoglobulin light chain junction region [Mus musculus]NSM00294.1 immunoglobulin light chain junction region [Mus musculus]NSM01780.1 immunoglobulin light chain junction region [Mus musculus]
CQQYWSIPWTF